MLSATPGGGLPRAGAPGDRAVLEVALSACSGAELVTDGITEATSLPSDAGPLSPDSAVDRPCSGRSCPVDRTAVHEVVEPPDPVGGPGLLGYRVTKNAPL